MFRRHQVISNQREPAPDCETAIPESGRTNTASQRTAWLGSPAAGGARTLRRLTPPSLVLYSQPCLSLGCGAEYPSFTKELLSEYLEHPKHAEERIPPCHDRASAELHPRTHSTDSASNNPQLLAFRCRRLFAQVQQDVQVIRAIGMTGQLLEMADYLVQRHIADTLRANDSFRGIDLVRYRHQSFNHLEAQLTGSSFTLDRRSTIRRIALHLIDAARIEAMLLGVSPFLAHDVPKRPVRFFRLP